MQNCGVGKMKDVVESVTVRIADVVSERITDRSRSIADKTCRLTADLCEPQTSRELFLHIELRIKVRQAASVRFQESAAHLIEISANYLGKDEAGSMQDQGSLLRRLEALVDQAHPLAVPQPIFRA